MTNYTFATLDPKLFSLFEQHSTDVTYESVGNVYYNLFQFSDSNGIEADATVEIDDVFIDLPVTYECTKTAEHASFHGNIHIVNAVPVPGIIDIDSNYADNTFTISFRVEEDNIRYSILLAVIPMDSKSEMVKCIREAIGRALFNRDYIVSSR